MHSKLFSSPKYKRAAPRPNHIVTSFTILFIFCSVLFYLNDPTKTSLTRQVRIPKGYGEAKVAFLIQAFSKTMELLPTLLPVIYHPKNIYCFHLDSDVPREDREKFIKLVRKYNTTGNIHFMRSRSVTYLGYTTMLNTFDAMSYLRRISDDWDYFINLSGSDYPLTRPEYIRKLLGTEDILKNKYNFVQLGSGNNGTSDFMYRTRFGKIFVDTGLWKELLDKSVVMGDSYESQDCAEGCLWRTATQAHPLEKSHLGKLPIVKAEAWVILHRSFVDFVIDSDISRRLMAISVNMLCPEEYFFATLIRMSPFANTGVYHSFRSIFWHLKTTKGSRAPVLDAGIPKMGEELAKTYDIFARKLLKPESELKTYINENFLGVDKTGRLDQRNIANAEERFKLLRKAVPCIVKVRYQWREFKHELHRCIDEQE